MTAISYAAPATGAEMPSPTELVALQNIVLSAHPWLTGFNARELGAGFWVTTRLFRTSVPDSTRYFASLVDEANAMLAQAGMPATSGPALLAAIIASGDVQWRRANPATGDVLEVGLNAYGGRKATNAWHSILAGTSNLLSPVAPRDPARDNLNRPLPTPAFFVEQDGQMRRVELTERGVP